MPACARKTRSAANLATVGFRVNIDGLIQSPEVKLSLVGKERTADEEIPHECATSCCQPLFLALFAFLHTGQCWNGSAGLDVEK